MDLGKSLPAILIVTLLGACEEPRGTRFEYCYSDEGKNQQLIYDTANSQIQFGGHIVDVQVEIRDGIVSTDLMSQFGSIPVSIPVDAASANGKEWSAKGLVFKATLLDYGKLRIVGRTAPSDGVTEVRTLYDLEFGVTSVELSSGQDNPRRIFRPCGGGGFRTGDLVPSESFSKRPE
jgi:hypothetical protein